MSSPKNLTKGFCSFLLSFDRSLSNLNESSRRVLPSIRLFRMLAGICHREKDLAVDVFLKQRPDVEVAINKRDSVAGVSSKRQRTEEWWQV